MTIMVNTSTTRRAQRERFSKAARMALALVLVSVFWPTAQANAQTIRPLSRGWLRMPYVDGTQMKGPSANNLFQGHNGHDVFGFPLKAWDDPTPYKIAAAADGVVFRVIDVFDECGLFPFGAPCNNNIWIDHGNGDITVYDHIAYQSARVDSGDVVVAGQWIADEGDVGSTESTDASLNRPKRGCDGTEDHTMDSIPYCGVHLHLSVTDSYLTAIGRDTVLVHPRICGTASHVWQPTTGTNPCVPCNATACVTDSIISESWSGDLAVVVVDRLLQTSGAVVVENSVVGFQAGEHVTLKPGFKALTGCYFRAEIGPCEGQ